MKSLLDFRSFLNLLFRSRHARFRRRARLLRYGDAGSVVALSPHELVHIDCYCRSGILFIRRTDSGTSGRYARAEYSRLVM